MTYAIFLIFLSSQEFLMTHIKGIDTPINRLGFNNLQLVTISTCM